eukprot:11340819-Alexandrium_andersonii.AAC.1
MCLCVRPFWLKLHFGVYGTRALPTLHRSCLPPPSRGAQYCEAYSIEPLELEGIILVKAIGPQ